MYCEFQMHHGDNRMNETPLTSNHAVESASVWGRGLRYRELIVQLVFWAAYIFLDRASIEFRVWTGTPAWYLPAGLTLAVLLCGGMRYLPVVIVSAATVAALGHRPMLSLASLPRNIFVSLCYSGGAEWLRRFWGLDLNLRRLRDVGGLTLFLVTFKLPAVLFSVLTYVADGLVPWRDFYGATFNWWVGDSISIVSLTPFLLLFVAPRVETFLQAKAVQPLAAAHQPLAAPEQLERLAELTSVLLALWLVFGFKLALPYQPLYLLFFPVIWMAVRRGLPRVALTVLAINLGVIVAAHMTHPDPESLPRRQLVMLALALTGISVGAVVSERRDAEEAQRQSQDELRNVLAFIPDYLWSAEIDRNGHHRYRYYSPVVQKITGRPPEYFLPGPERWLGIVHPDDQARIKTAFEITRAGQIPEAALTTEEYRIIRPDGNIRWVRDSVQGRHYKGGIRIDGVVSDVTERKLAEQALRESEQRYRDFIEHSHEGVWRLELEPPLPLDLPVEEALVRLLKHGYIAECNEAHAQITGFATVEEIIGKPLGELISPLDEERLATFRESAQLGWRSRTVEFRGLDPKRDFRHLRRTEIPIVHNGMLVRVWGITRDITELRRAEEEVLFKTTLLAAEAETTIDGILVVDKMGQVLFSNRRFEEIWKIPAALTGARDHFALIEHALTQVKDPRGFSERLEYLYSRETEKSRDEIELTDGSVIDRYSAPLKDPTGKLYGRIWYLRDITDRKRAAETLRQSEERFRTTFENAGIGMAIVDLQGHPIESNPALHRMLGYSEEELSGMLFTEFTHPHDRDLDWALYGELAEGKRDRYAIEKRYIRKDGQLLWGLLTVSLVKDTNGAPEYAVGMVEDITERKRAQDDLQLSFEQLRALAARLESVREEERRRVAREIHDQLGQALTAIKIDLSSLLGELPSERGQRSKRASAVFQLVDETIQAVRRISAELRPGILDDLGLAATLEWAGEEFEARTGTKCHLDLPREEIDIDPECATAIFRIFQETLTNVARHAEASEVQVRLAREDGDLTLEVRDNGKGVAEEHLSRGRSLGILGMRERVSLLGGELVVRGAAGKGTTVSVRIPQVSPARGG